MSKAKPIWFKVKGSKWHLDTIAGLNVDEVLGSKAYLPLIPECSSDIEGYSRDMICITKSEGFMVMREKPESDVCKHCDKISNG